MTKTEIFPEKEDLAGDREIRSLLVEHVSFLRRKQTGRINKLEERIDYLEKENVRLSADVRDLLKRMEKAAQVVAKLQKGN